MAFVHSVYHIVEYSESNSLTLVYHVLFAKCYKLIWVFGKVKFQIQYMHPTYMFLI